MELATLKHRLLHENITKEEFIKGFQELKEIKDLRMIEGKKNAEDGFICPVCDKFVLFSTMWTQMCLGISDFQERMYKFK